MKMTCDIYFKQICLLTFCVFLSQSAFYAQEQNIIANTPPLNSLNYGLSASLLSNLEFEHGVSAGGYIEKKLVNKIFLLSELTLEYRGLNYNRFALGKFHAFQTNAALHANLYFGNKNEWSLKAGYFRNWQIAISNGRKPHHFDGFAIGVAHHIRNENKPISLGLELNESDFLTVFKLTLGFDF